jgi:hypothetical protein
MAEPLAGKGTSADVIEDLFNTPDDKADDKVDDKDDKVDDKEDKDDVDDDKDDDKDEDEDEDEEPEIDLDEDADDDEDKDEEEEKLDLKDDSDVDAPPRKAEIEKAFPGVFKKFKFLEKMMFRDKAYTELFGSFDDAKELAGRAVSFNKIEKDLLSGDTTDILKRIKDADSSAFDKVVDNYLVSLGKVDKDAYMEVAGNVAKRILSEAFAAGKAEDNEDLQLAAEMINRYLFGKKEIQQPTRRTTEKEEKDTKVEDERKAFLAERFETAHDELLSRVNNTLRNTISEYIDPKEQMSAYEKKNATKDALDSLHKLLGRDTGLRKRIDSLWQAAEKDKFSRDSVRPIQSLFLGRSKKVLPSVIKKARAEALKDKPHRARKEDVDDERDEKDEKDETPRKRNIQPGRPRQKEGGKLEMRKGESVADFLARD